MKHELKVFKALSTLAIKIYLENRWNTIGNLLNTFLNFFLSVIFINIIYLSVKTLNGWTKNEVLMILGGFIVVDSLFVAFFKRSINNITNYVQWGQMDNILTKPINSQFFISFRLFKPFQVINSLVGVALIIYAINQSKIEVTFFNILVLVIGLVCGLLILYAIYYMVGTLAIWIINFNSINSVYNILTSPTSLPTNIYGNFLSFILTYVVPLGFIVMFPVKNFLHFDPSFLIIEIILMSLLLLASILFWKYALRHYTSASS